MTIAKRILITAESREVVIVRRGGASISNEFCHVCCGEVTFLTLDESVEYARVPTWEMIRQILLGTIHSRENGRGQLLVCRDSLELVERSKE